ncbi:VOC family protein [Streptomyces sp. NPDC086091]|uniref:VOC family protein n=1 Tax=Streptomyces sp. NPDC086091 TaxID=3365751 RepID=UPI0037F127FD
MIDSAMPSAPPPPVRTGIPTARAVDHFAFTVPDLDEAVGFFTGVLGGEVCYREGPVEDTTGDWMTRKLGVHPRARAMVALLRLGPHTNLELFEYTAPDQVTAPPGPHDVGGHHLALSVADLDTAEARLRAAGTVRLGPAGTAGALRRWFLTPWGTLLSLRGPGHRDGLRFVPDGRTYGDTARPGGALNAAGAAQGGEVPYGAGGAAGAEADPRGGGPGIGLLGVEHVSYTVADLDAATAFFTDILGALTVPDTALPDDRADHPDAPGPPGTAHTRRTLLRLGPTANCELVQSGTGAPRSRPPRNSDVGGHHLAFYVDDVDQAAAYLGRQPGVTLMGEPETITAGPIAGDRWLYFGTPIGIQMEIIHMPDGSLPYERLTSARRAIPGGLRWHDRP